MTQSESKHGRRWALFATVGAVALALATPGQAPAQASPASADHRAEGSVAAEGNVLLIVTDDMRYDDLAYMPKVQSLLVDRGTSFSRFYAPFALCCPARATILTGQYAHNHGVLSNEPTYGGFNTFRDDSTLATWLTPTHRVGLVGRYLNGYGRDDPLYVPPGWDSWRGAIDGSVWSYLDLKVNVNGRYIQGFRDQNSSSAIGDQSQRFISRFAKQPFFLEAAFVAPHHGTPVESDDLSLPTPYVGDRYRDTYVGPALPEDPTFNEPDTSDKRPTVQGNPLLTKQQIAAVKESIAQRRESLRVVDDEVAGMVRTLRREGILDDTYIVFLSDNGYLEGEHRIVRGKGLPYAAASHVPLVVRGPEVPAGVTVDGIAGQHDLAPTILRMTGTWGAQGTSVIDGRSLMPYFTNPSAGDNRTLVLEAGDNRGGYSFHGIVRGDGWKYVEFTTRGVNETEMYDLTTDPYEDFNLSEDPAYDLKQAELAAETEALKFCAGRACR